VRLLPFISTLILLPVSLLPTYYGYGGYYVGIVSLVMQFDIFIPGFMLMRNRDIKSAKSLMYGSFLYLPVVQLMFLFDFIGKVK
jgi:protoheme IX farnesyltransferase